MSTTDTRTLDDPPVRVCRKCSTQAQTSGDFCPHCGARYSKKKRSKKARALIIGVPLAALIAAAVIAAALIVHHSNQVAARKRAQHAAAVAAARRRHRAAVAAAAAAAAQRKAQQAAAALKRDEAKIMRQSMVSALQGAVQKDAEKDVNEGLLNGPIIKVQCEPATAVDATASIANYTCLAATSQTGTELSGYRFSATINTNTGSYTWHLGG